MIDVLLFYLLAALVFGVIAASFDKVEVKLGGRILPCSRLIGGVALGAIWPWFLLRLLFAPLPSGERSRKQDGGE